jgi:flagellar FliL protein
MTAPTVTLPVDTGKGEGAAAPKKSKKKLIIILVAVLVVGGLGAKMTVLKKKPAKVAPKPGAVLVIDDATINLAAGHYLKLGLSLQLEGKTDPTTVDGSAASDLANQYFTGKAVTLVISAAGRDAAKAALAKQIEAVPEYKDEVMGIYFRDYVTQ